MPAATLDQVPNAPLRERYLVLAERDGLTLSRLAELAGVSDSTAVARMLGLRLDARFAGGRRESVDYDRAVRIARALGLDPFEAGV